MNTKGWVSFLVAVTVVPLAAQDAAPECTYRWVAPEGGDFVVLVEEELPEATGDWEMRRRNRVLWNLRGRRGVATVPHASVGFVDYDPVRDHILAVHKRGVERFDPATGKREALWTFDERGSLLLGWARRDGATLWVPGMEFVRRPAGMAVEGFLGRVDLATGTTSKTRCLAACSGLHVDDQGVWTVLRDELARFVDDDGATDHERLGPVPPGWSLLGVLDGAPVFRSADHARVVLDGRELEVEGLDLARTHCLDGALLVLSREGVLTRVTPDGALVRLGKFEKVNGFGGDRRRAWLAQADGTVTRFDADGRRR